MRIDIHHHFSRDEEVPPWAKALINKVNLLLQKSETTMATMEELRAAVARNTSVDDSVIALLQGIAQQLRDAQAANDPAAIAAVIAELDANTQKMTDAVTANTPSA